MGIPQIREEQLPLGRHYWNRQGNRFHRSFFGAKSTLFYLEEEQRLCNGSFKELENKKLLKLDAWNEAQNTEILFWAARQGAECYTVDIAESTAVKARDRSRALDTPIRIAVADILDLPNRIASCPKSPAFLRKGESPSSGFPTRWILFSFIGDQG
jgi:hypothetical protein